MPFSRLRKVLGALPKASGFCVFVVGALTMLFTLLIRYFRFPIALPSEVLGTLIGTSITLIVIGLNDIVKFYSSTADLEGPEVYPPEVFRLSEKYVAYRISVLVRNSGSVAVRDAKVMLELESLGPEELSRLIVKDCNFEWNALLSVMQAT